MGTSKNSVGVPQGEADSNVEHERLHCSADTRALSKAFWPHGSKKVPSQGKAPVRKRSPLQSRTMRGENHTRHTRKSNTPNHTHRRSPWA